LLSYCSTPIIEIQDSILNDASVRLCVKREDLNHPFVSGNKWWKLKYNLEEAQRLKKNTLLTFGGSFSNHIYATAAAAHELGWNSIGVIRGEESLPLNPTLRFATHKGMKLHYVSRGSYREKAEEYFTTKLKEQFGDFYRIPEGGSNTLAVKGVEELTKELGMDFDYLCTPVGTGGTLAGLIRGLKGEKIIVGFSALKDGAFLRNDVTRLGSEYGGWKIITDYHFGGYAKSTAKLLQFMDDFKKLHTIPLEFTYTGKMMFGIFDMIQKGFFKKGSRVLAIHTGGIHTFH
jgi:1-aminocyclopropane-1-carboxylate deaminase